MTPILEPILAGLTVSLINKYIVNNSALWLWCSPPDINLDSHEDDLSSSNTTVSDVSLETPHHFYIH
jgi:hypothetical protein